MSTVWQKSLASWTPPRLLRICNTAGMTFRLFVLFPRWRQRRALTGPSNRGSLSMAPPRAVVWRVTEAVGQRSKDRARHPWASIATKQRNTESYCEILEIAALAYSGHAYNWLRFKTELSIFLPYPSFPSSKTGCFSYLRRQGLAVVSSMTRQWPLQPYPLWVGPRLFEPRASLQKLFRRKRQKFLNWLRA